MVPNREEPLYTRLLDFINEKRITFAASNFDTTSELTLQIVWWGQQNRHTMKQTTSNSKNTMNKKADQKQFIKSKSKHPFIRLD